MAYHSVITVPKVSGIVKIIVENWYEYFFCNLQHSSWQQWLYSRAWDMHTLYPIDNTECFLPTTFHRGSYMHDSDKIMCIVHGIGINSGGMQPVLRHHSDGSNAQIWWNYRQTYIPAWLARRCAASTVESWTVIGRCFHRLQWFAGRCWSTRRPWVESGPTSMPGLTHTAFTHGSH